MLVFPKAKINLGLRITGKRPDGYHNIETIFYPLGFCDALEFIVNTDGNEVKDSLTITGYQLQGQAEDNLVMKAAAKLRENYFIPPLKIHLHKNIPAGSGLGGGSSDSACMLRTLTRFFKLPLSVSEIKILAGEIGSDCPFFVDSRPSIALGRGEILAPLTCFLDGYYIVIVNPGVHVNTREAYGNCSPSNPEEPLSNLILRPITEWKETVINDFEKTVFVRYPVIREAKESLYDSGALYSSMSGSGSAVFGIFSGRPELSSRSKKLIIYQGSL